MKKAYIFLAEGFEEVEALMTVDIVRRAGIEMKMVSITGSKQITGSHGIKVEADELFEEIQADTADMLVLPGGMPGTKHLAAHGELVALLKSFHAQGKALAAICAAPSVLGENGLLTGKKATCYPGFEEALKGAEVLTVPAVTDGNVITGRGLGAAIDFASEIVTLLISAEKAKEIKEQIQFPY